MCLHLLCVFYILMRSFIYCFTHPSTFSPSSLLPPYHLNKSFPLHLTICYYYLPSIHSTALYKAYKISYTRLIKQKCPLTIACMQTPLSLLAQNEGKEIRETDGLLSAGIYISLLLRRFLCETEVRSLIPSRSGAYKTTPVFQTRPSHS